MGDSGRTILRRAAIRIGISRWPYSRRRRPSASVRAAAAHRRACSPVPQRLMLRLAVRRLAFIDSMGFVERRLRAMRFGSPPSGQLVQKKVYTTRSIYANRNQGGRPTQQQQARGEGDARSPADYGAGGGLEPVRALALTSGPGMSLACHPPAARAGTPENRSQATAAA